MKLHELPKGTKFALMKWDIWEFNWIDGTYGKFKQGNERYFALLPSQEVEEVNWVYQIIINKLW